MIHTDLIKIFLTDLQNRLCDALTHHESTAQFHEDFWSRDNVGSGYTRILKKGEIFDQAGVNFSHVSGNHLPQASTQKHPQLVGAAFEALGLSSVIHPHNPFVPTAHLNVRYFQAITPAGKRVWWFGGGYDLTPYYAFEDDCIHWHKTAKKACDDSHPDFYARFKKAADNYFYIKHRQECRGIGGLFFDDLNELSFEDCFSFMKNIGNSFIDAYLPLVAKRKDYEFSNSNRDFMHYRRGRYVEFNLVYDRGTLFGLQFGGRTESILMSLPPQVNWHYDWKPDPHSPEAQLTDYFLKPQAWAHKE